MSVLHSDDPLLDAIGALPVVRPDDVHTERLRGRCRAALHEPRGLSPVALEPATVGTICAVYAWHVAKIATRIPLP